MEWIRKTRDEISSDCGNYRVRGGHTDGNYWRAIHAPTGYLVVASSDKDFVKARCESDASARNAKRD